MPRIPRMLSLLSLLIAPLFSLPAMEEMAYYERKVDSCIALGDVHCHVHWLMELGASARYEGEMDRNDSCQLLALKLAQEHGMKEQEGEAYNYLGINQTIRGNYELASKYYQKGIEASLEANDSITLSNIYENWGLATKDCGKYQESLKYQLKALTIKKSIGSTSRIPPIYQHIASIYSNMDDYEMQGKYLALALKYAKIYDVSEYDQISILNELGIYMSYMGDEDSSIVCHQMVVDRSRAIGWLRGEAAGLGNLAGQYREGKDVDKAIEMHLRALEIEEEIANVYGQVAEHSPLAELYLESGLIDKAFEHARLGYQLSEKHELLDYKMDMAKYMSRCFEAFHQYDSALVYLKEMHALKDSVSAIEHRKHIANLETEFQTKEKEQEIELLTQENIIKDQRNKATIGLLISALALIVIGVMVQRNRKQKAQMQTQELQHQLFRSQMSPHFLFNALASIKHFMLENQAAKASGYLDNFAVLTRSVLSHSGQEQVPLSEEVNSLESYIELERLRCNNSFECSISVIDKEGQDLGEDAEFIEVPPMMLQPFVENAIKHGFKEMKRGGQLTISFKETANKSLLVTIENDGRSLEESLKEKTEDKHKSMSLAIFKARKRILEKKLKKDLIFKIEDMKIAGLAERGTRVCVELPILDA